MIEIIQEYWKNYLFTDGYRITGLAITMWLLVISIGLGFCLSVPLAVARVSKNKLLSRGVWLYTYVFRGTPLYVQLLLCYTGLYSLQVVRDHMLLDRVLPQRHELHAARVHAEHLRVHDGNLRRRDQGDALRRDRSRARVRHVAASRCIGG